jgi:uncharacterized membrane protein YdjX (TVP38/TMEM64 family)
MSKGKRAFRIIVLLIVAALVAWGTVYATRWIWTLRDADKLAAFQERIDSLGVWGFVVLLAIQYVQIVIAFIPGGPIQMVAGALFGPLLGVILCLLGTVLATATVFSLVRRFGASVISLFVDDKDITQYKFLKDAKRLEWLTVILFFIPGAPKDALTYLFALTIMPMSRFMLLATAARLPAMVTAIFAGDRIMSGQWFQAGILFVSITIIGAVGLLLHRKILKHFAKRH